MVEPDSGGAGARSTSNGQPASIDQMATQLSETARRLQATEDTGEMLEEVVAAAVALIPGAEEASLSVVTGRRRVESQHPSSELPERVDAMQTEVGEGPCLDAIYEHQTVSAPDMAHEQRWPRFARRAHELGVGSMLSFQLYVEKDNLGALNLYNRAAHGFDEESAEVGLLFASHAAIAFADAQKLDQTLTAVRSRDVIGQAKGILMERYGIDDDRAFLVLRRYSQSSHRKLHDVARELVTSRQLPVLDRDPRDDGQP